MLDATLRPAVSRTSEAPVADGGAAADLRRVQATMIAAARGETLEEALQAVLASAASACGAAKSFSTVIEHGVERVATSVGLSETFIAAIDRVWRGHGTWGAAVQRGTLVQAADVARDEMFAACREAAELGEFVACESFPLTTSAGELVGVLTLLYHERRVADERQRGFVECCAVIAADQIVQRRERKGLQRNEERFRLLASHAPVGIFISDAQGDSVFLNDAWCRLAGMDAATARGRGWINAIHPDDRERVVAEWELAVRERRPSVVEYRFQRADGSVIWLQGNAVQVRDPAGDVTGHIGTIVEITERKLAELAVRESEQRLRVATQTGKVGVWDWDMINNRVVWTDSLYAIHGVRPEEFEGTVEGWGRLVHEDDRSMVEAKLRQALEAGEDYSVEFRAVRPDGGVVWLYTHAVTVRQDEKPVRMIGATLDVTDRRAGDEANRRLAAIVESSEDAIISTDLRGTITSWNRGAERLYGYTREEAIGRSIGLLLPAGSDEEQRIIERISRGERIEHYETARRHKSGQLVDVSLTVSPLRDSRGNPVGTSKIARDITERKRQEAELRRQQKLYRAVGESIDFGIWVSDAQGRNLYASESFLKLVGMTQQECSEWGWAKALPDEEVGPMQSAWAECVQRGGVWERELLFRGVDGQWHPVLSRGVPIRDEDGRIAYWAGINLDITAFKKTEAALRQNEQQLRLVTDNAIVFLAHCDRDYRLKFANRPYAQRFGRMPEELVGKSIAELVGAEAFESFKVKLDESLKGNRVEFEIEIPYEQFGRRWMRVIHEPERDAQGNVIGVVAVINDITARKKAEHDMEVARDKAEAASRAKDDFLAALSHELRTPLNPVLLLASEHASDVSLPEQVRADFQTIRKNVELEARLIDDLLDLTRITRGKLSLNLAVQDLHAVLQDAIATMRPDLEVKALTLTFELHAAQTRVWADAVRLQQVFWNVLKNAVKFTPEDGRILVRTRNDPAKSRVVIEVHDSGIGMSAAELARVFDAFSQGDHASSGGPHRFGGVGLGLTISRMLVELHRGSIRAESKGRDCGSTFTVELPLAENVIESEPRWVRPRGASAAPFSVANDAADYRPRLLLVEDHEPTRVALAHLLTRRDFEVLQAPNTSSALTIAASGGIDLVISDIGLPDGNGFELMQELRRRHGLQGIALTGYGMDHDIIRGQQAGFVVHLTKPVTVHALEKALRTALADR